jgi:hypothetical protein
MQNIGQLEFRIRNILNKTNPDHWFDIGTLWMRILPFFQFVRRAVVLKIYAHRNIRTVAFTMFKSKQMSVLVTFSLK